MIVILLASINMVDCLYGVCSDDGGSVVVNVLSVDMVVDIDVIVVAIMITRTTIFAGS